MRQKLHIAHLTPNLQRSHFPFQEVIEALGWGLTQLGYAVGHALHAMDATATNIVMGCQLMPLEQVKQLPPDTIIYNLEQMRGIPPRDVKDSVRYAAENFQIWDYSPGHTAVWQQMPLKYPVKVLPVAYAPILTRIPRAQPQDIDVFLYGTPGRERLKAFSDLNDAGLTAVLATGCYGATRDSLIARSKIILNVGVNRPANHFEIVRVGYLLANAKAVVAEKTPDMFIEPDMPAAVALAPLEKIAATCRRLVDNDTQRLELEKRGFEIFSRRDIRELLKSVLN
jgi:hypothetical protein